MLGVDPPPVLHGQSLRPYLEGKRPSSPRDHVFSEYLENEEAFVRDDRWKLIVSSGRRRRTDGYETDKPTPGRYVILFDRQSDPGEFENVASRHPEIVARMEDRMLARFRQTHPEASREPQRLSREEAIEWYLRPRDGKP
jgi:choline-sulfatase